MSKKSSAASAPTSAPAAAASAPAVQGLPPAGTLPDRYYVPRHLEVQLDSDQAQALTLLRVGLQEQGVDVRSNAQAVKWLLNRIAESYGVTAAG